MARQPGKPRLFDPCISVIREASGDLITEDQAEALIRGMTSRLLDSNGHQLDQIEKRLNEAGASEVDKLKLEKTIVKRNALLTIKAWRNIENFVSGFKTYGEGLDAFMNGSKKLIKSGRNSIHAQTMATRGKYIGQLLDGLEKTETLDIFVSNELDRETYTELWNIRNPDNKVNSSGSAKAAEMAKVIYGIQEELRLRENRAGGYIGEEMNYITRQTHDADKIRRAGGMGDSPGSKEASYIAWSESVKPLLDEERTFDGVPISDREEFLRKVHEGILTGIHGKFGRDLTDTNREFRNTGSLARKLSSTRVIHFKDPDSAYKYSQMFGRRTLNESIVHEVKVATHVISIMENFGPNPEMTFDRLIRYFNEQAVGREDDVAQKTSLDHPFLRDSFNTLLGKNDNPANMTLHRITQGLTAWTLLSKGGAIILSAIPDKAFFHMAASYQGINTSDILKAQFKAVIPKTAEELSQMRKMGVAIDGFLGEVASRFTNQSNTGGVMFKLQQNLFKINGLNWWNDSHKGAFARLMANHLGEHSHLNYQELPVDLQRLFNMYGIGRDEWALARTTAYTIEGERFFTPEQIPTLHRNNVENYMETRNIGKTPDNYKRILDELETKFRTLITDQVDDAVVTPGNREKTITNLGTRAGTWGGMAVRLLMIFKSFPITVFTRIIQREIHGRGNYTGVDALLKSGNFRLAQLLAMTTIGGYISMSIQDMLMGRAPRRLINDDGSWNGKVILESMVRGGGAGIYGDFLLTEYDRSYKSFTSVVAGPVFGQVNEIAALGTDISRYARGNDKAPELSTITRSAEKLITGNVPYINLFYIRPILDYSILWNLEEMVSPGSMRKMERSVEKNNHQDFFIRPTEVVSK